jgi:hypothetical protein
MPRNNRLFLAIVLALGSLGSPVLAADGKKPAPQPGTLRVLTIGVAKPAANKVEALLPGADCNAQDVAAFFQGQEGKLYEQVQVAVLVNQEATRDNILAYLDCLADEFQPGDTAIVHISAHGGEVRGQWRLAAYDHPFDGWTRGMVSARELRDRLEKLPGKVILILDSCHSGAFGDGVGNRSVRGEAGLVVYAAALSDQFGWYKGWLGHGVFTHALLEALSGKADFNKDGVVTLAEVDAYVAARVAELTRDSRTICRIRGIEPKDQTPTMSKPSTISSNAPLAVVAQD